MAETHWAEKIIWPKTHLNSPLGRKAQLAKNGRADLHSPELISVHSAVFG
jgi:hypothetical protein